ncbi:MAG: hypothetical protein M1837_006214 [Sclerophora amabilis]|nr:MAG: hypothetical protein M1837_006214 [Sclerophora amabilis]
MDEFDDADLHSDSPSFSWLPRSSTKRKSENQTTASEYTTSEDPPSEPGSKTTLPQDLPHRPKSSSGISLRAFVLGQVFGISLIITLYGLVYSHNPAWRASFFLSSLTLFHFLEFWITARFNTRHATVSAFLLSSNGSAYNVAHSAALCEFLLTHYFLSSSGGTTSGSHGLFSTTTHTYVTDLGLLLMILGQGTRSMAMAQAGQNFNHVVQTKRSEEHQLVTHGIYAYLRHPSYFGFFWWGLGTQIMLGNIVCLTAYALVLWRFFSRRIQSESSLVLLSRGTVGRSRNADMSRVSEEEELLDYFFGKRYKDYKSHTTVGIPFIP